MALIRRIGPSLLLALLSLPAADRAGAVCESFLYSASYFCGGSPHCIQVSANASGGGPVYNEFRWTKSTSPLIDSLEFTSGDGISEAMSTCASRSEIGEVAVAAIATSSGVLELGVSSSGNCYAMFRISDLTFSGPAPTVETSLNLDLYGTFGVASSGNSDTNASATSILVVRGAVCHANGTNIFDFLGERDRFAEDFGSDPPETTDRKNSGVLLDHSLSGPLAIGPFDVPTDEPLQLEIEILVDAISVVGKHVPAEGPPSGSASATSDFGNTLEFSTDGPPFTLPDGFGVVSEQAGIVVPEPGWVAMSFATLLALAMLRRHSA